MDAGEASDAGPRPIPGARLTAEGDGGAPPVAELDGGWDDAGEGGPATADLSTPDASIDDRTILTFTANVPLDDFRTRLLGSDGQLVANHAETWVADGGTRVKLFPAPLWPARGCCRFVVDGESGKLPAAGGLSYLPFEAEFGVLPDPARPAPPPHRARHRRRRR